MVVRTWGNVVTTEYVPEEISRRQLFQVLANRGMITKAEALNAVTVAMLPAAIEDIIALISDADLEWDVRMLFAGANQFKRAHPYVNMFGAMQGLDAVALDQLWRDGAQLE